MSELRQDAMFSYFDERIASCERKREALLKDDRADEAVFERIRANVYDIFKAMLRVSVKAGGGEEKAVRRFFLEKVEEIPVSWEESCRKAEQHGDVEKVRIETIKLETVKGIRAAFGRIWEAQP
ncbi:MAG: hypothetical protein ABFC62_03550 [Clostridiaceae bacterium]|nr:hypothetical protein [Eubacteriales bacterium]